MEKLGLSEDKKYATYKTEFVREIMHYLEKLDTDESKEILRKMIHPYPPKIMSDAQVRYHAMTEKERQAVKWALSLEKDSDALNTIKKLSLFKNSDIIV